MKRKITNKRRTTKQKKKQQKCSAENIYFEVILIIILIPLFSFMVLSIFKENDFRFVGEILASKTNVKIITDKNFYAFGENIKLFIKNESINSIYFEPCEYLNKFEKKIDGKWKKSSSYEGIKIYDEFGFKKEKNITNCEIELPKEGAGLYRTVIQIYYNCEKPGENMCESSKVFYSNEFEVKSDGSFCEDKVLENCDGKKVSVMGTFITSKAYFLSEIENREVKYQWAGEIMIDDSEGMKDGKRYKVIGIVRKGGQPCGMNGEQCMLDEKGVVLPYPTRIEVEKIYSVK